MTSLLLLLSTLPAFAATPAPAAPTPALAEEHLVEIAPFGGKAENTVLAVVMECWPTDTQNQLKYTTAVQDFAIDAHAAADALSTRNDTRVVRLFNPTPTEFDATMDVLHAELGEDGRYAKLGFLYAGLAKGGDMNDEVAMCPGGGIPWSDITTRMKTLSDVAIGVLDASHDVSKSTSDLGPTFGFTANDWRDAEMSDGFAISAGPEGKYSAGGLLTAFAKTVAASKGGTMSMGDLVLGLRTNAPLLEIAFSTGVDPNDQWTDNTGRQMFPGGGIKKPVIVATLPTTALTKPKGKAPIGWIEVGGGAAFSVASIALGATSGHNYDLLVGYNTNGGETQAQLDDAVGGYRNGLIGSVATGVLGLAGITLGTITLIDNGHGHTATVVPTGNGVRIGGTF
ncbi:MAG: hypothetical protein AAB473_04195 [Patescibacteria group bacterium]